MIRPQHPTPLSMRTTRACSVVQHAVATTRTGPNFVTRCSLFFLFLGMSDGSPRRTALGQQSGQVQPASQPGNNWRSLPAASLLPLASSTSSIPGDWRVDRMKMQSRTHPSRPASKSAECFRKPILEVGGQHHRGNRNWQVRSQRLTRGFPGAALGRASFLFRWRA